MYILYISLFEGFFPPQKLPAPENILLNGLHCSFMREFWSGFLGKVKSIFFPCFSSGFQDIFNDIFIQVLRAKGGITLWLFNSSPWKIANL